MLDPKAAELGWDPRLFDPDTLFSSYHYLHVADAEMVTDTGGASVADILQPVRITKEALLPVLDRETVLMGVRRYRRNSP